jgi:hypothetical protein
LCVVHQVRASLNYVSWKQRKAVAADLQPIYRASTVEEAEQRLYEFASKWDGAYPTISQMWRRNWEQLTPFFAYPADIRKVIYTTNAVESLNMSLRKVIKTRGSFPNQEAAMKLLYLALEHIAKKVDHAGAELESRSAALRDSARRPRSESGVSLNHRGMNHRKKNISGIGGSAPQPPEIYRFCARIPGPGGELRSRSRNPGPSVGARVASPQSPTLRSGPSSLPGMGV